MFTNLAAELARKKMSIKDLSLATGIEYTSLRNKMSGNTEFKLSELLEIQKNFSGCTLEYLFDTKETR